jgi:hypothetical protein
MGLLTMACRTLQQVLSALMVLAVMACSLFLSKEARYLLSAKNRATEAEVRQRLGEPLNRTLNHEGHTKWVYETKTHVQEGTNNAWTTFDSLRCDTYSLMFDENHILRHWTHTSWTCQ